PVVGELGGRDALQRALASHDLACLRRDPGQDALDHRIGFRVDGGRVQGLVAIRNPQEACRLFKGLVAEARDFEQSLASGEGTVAVPPGNDVLGEQGVQARDAGQQGRRGGVDVHADRVYAVLDHRIQRAGQFALVDVMLILSDAYGLGLDLDEFGERVLKTAVDGQRTAQAYDQSRKFVDI